jgi:hypothetical protein
MYRGWLRSHAGPSGQLEHMFTNFDPNFDPNCGDKYERGRPGAPRRASTGVLILRLRGRSRAPANGREIGLGLTLNQPVLGSSPRGLTSKSSSSFERPS